MSSMRVSWLFCVMSACLMSTVSHAAEQTPLAVGNDTQTSAVYCLPWCFLMAASTTSPSIAALTDVLT